MGALKAAVIGADAQDSREICALLEQANLSVTPLSSLESVFEYLKKERVGVLIVDMDTLPVDNKFFRGLKKQYPNLHILCLSSRTHHPGLEEAMGSHINVSLAKPVNSEELFFWLKSITDI